VKSFLIGATFVAVGVWYVGRVVHDRSDLPEPRDPPGEIVIANAPDGTLQGRWPSATPTATHSQ
jgi:hypothetical protein